MRGIPRPIRADWDGYSVGKLNTAPPPSARDRYYMSYTLNTSENAKAEFDKIKALPGLKSIAVRDAPAVWG